MNDMESSKVEQSRVTLMDEPTSSSNSGARTVEEIKIPVPYGHISGKWWGPRTEQPIIAIHGWQDNAGTWDKLIPLLPNSLSVLAIDLPGHGLSSHYPKGQFYYLFWDGVIVVRRIVKYFNWKKITIMGHSLGGAIGFLYAGIFPDEVSNLISIDIVSPTIREVAFQTDNAAGIVDQFLKYETLTEANMPCYSYEEMIDIVEDAYKGSITRDSCKILMKRGMALTPNNKGYHFSRDVRLKVSGLGLLSQDLVMEFASKIKCNVLNIKGVPGMSFDKPEYYYIVLNKIRENAHVEFHEVEGTHHLHLNTPERINKIIADFIQKSYTENDESSSGSGSDIYP
ncbi:UNVERIFIED_CONTAM: hypothetical protein PYX00_009867 [Menopon gallinae]|uniref:AB hydrolase-1 domain-containing protein n=1 Tax=Menopon gallinae TaxID=328185 RepID=A0AAW2HD34_9NEOP